MERLKTAYSLWCLYYLKIPKHHRFSLGAKLDNLLVETIEFTTIAAFTPQLEKIPYIRAAIRKLDTFKILLAILWDNKSIETQQYTALSEHLFNIGKMLGGWHGHILKQNSPQPKPGEK